MKNIKRFLTVFFSVILVFSLATFSAFSATYIVYDHYKYSRNGDGTITIVEYDNSSTDMVVPESILSETVTAISLMAFMNNTDVQTVSLPDTLVTIDNFAFCNMTSLRSINIPVRCTSVGTGMLQGCTSLTDVNFESPLTSISQQMFYKCTALETIVIPDTVESIGRFAFRDCSSLKSVTIPKNVISIESDSFMNCADFTIYGYKDSYAQQFAQENGIPFIALDKYEMGDVTLDGKLNIKDATKVQRYAASLVELSDEAMSVADVNNDGRINVLDATEIQRKIAGFDVDF